LPSLRILYLAPCRPTERSFGTQLRTLQVASALQKLGELDVVVVKHAQQDDTEDPGAGARFNIRRVIRLQPRPTRTLADRWRCAFDARYLGYHGHGVEEADRLFVLNELPHYDLVWLHQLPTANVFGRWAWPRSVMDLDDIPSTYLRTLADESPGTLARFRGKLQLKVARRRERLLVE